MNHLENAAAVTDAQSKPSEPLPQVKSEIEQRALASVATLDVRPGVRVSPISEYVIGGGEKEIISAFTQSYEAGLAARREARRAQDEIDAKANAIYEQHRVIEQATQEINSAKHTIAAAQDRIAIAQRRIAELG